MIEVAHEKIRSVEKDIQGIYSRLDYIEKLMENKVAYRTFMLVFTILSGILGYMVWQMNDIRANTQLAVTKIAAIEATMRQYNFTLDP